MKVLVLDEEFPYPLNSGKRIRSYNLLSRIAAKHEMRYLAYGTEESSSFRQFQESIMGPVAVRRQVPKQSGLGFYLRLLANIASRYPYIVSSHFSKRFLAAVNELVSSWQPDIVVCEWTPYTIFAQRLKLPATLLVAHNIESDIWWRYFQHESNPVRKWYIYLQARKVESFERKAFAWVDGATVVSGKDGDRAREFNGSVPVSVIDNGVDLEYFSQSGASSDKPNLVFTGSMDWRPNQDAAQYFAKDILPLLRKTYPDTKATFVGRNPSDEMVALGQADGIEITGTVDDVRPYIERASVYIVPLRVGGGSRLKILEAMAMGVPVVSTRVGAEGLDVKDGKSILLADSPEEFSAAVIKVLTDPSLADTLQSAGRELVERKYSWDQIALRLENFMQETIESKSMQR